MEFAFFNNQILLLMFNILKIKSNFWRRFTIIYFLINFIALGTSSLNLNVGYLKKEYIMKSKELIEYEVNRNQILDATVEYYIFTGGDENSEKKDKNIDHFWPFINFYNKGLVRSWFPSGNLYSFRITFWGIFKYYDFTEFIFYCSIPFIILLIKKLW